ncbi:MAG TPA: sigma-70 family RNA polymerase sigma factor [Abditibacteriaceae bacterium]|jgi:RNA polymerase sigma-70 factor (ECF subfamily)
MIGDDARRIRQLKSGDRAAFEDIVSRHYQSVYRQLWHLCNNEQIAAELTQETFVQAWKSLDSFSGRAALRTWLYTIGVRVWHRWKNSNDEPARENAPPENWAESLTDYSPGPAQLLETQATQQEVQTALQQLPAAYREAIVLFYIQGLKYREVALALDVPLGTVKSRLHQGLQRMRALMMENTESDLQEGGTPCELKSLKKC